jgi:hypothetical protein
VEVFLEKVLPALLGLAAGVAGSLVAPWVHWGVDKRRARMEFRRTQLARWRKYMNELYNDLDFTNRAEYSEMRPHLSKETRAMTEGNQITIRDGRGGNVVKSAVLDDLAGLESKWHLI